MQPCGVLLGFWNLSNDVTFFKYLHLVIVSQAIYREDKKLNRYKKEPVHIKPEEIFRLCTFGFSDCIYSLHSTNSRSCNVTVVECYTWEVDKILCARCALLHFFPIVDENGM